MRSMAEVSAPSFTKQRTKPSSRSKSITPSSMVPFMTDTPARISTVSPSAVQEEMGPRLSSPQSRYPVPSAARVTE